MTRLNPFACSYCGVPAIWRHYAPGESNTPGRHVASFCAEHSPMYTDTLIIPPTGASSAPVSAESVENCGKVSGPPTESGEFGASMPTATPDA